jgi:hypothetical protein
MTAGKKALKRAMSAAGWLPSSRRMFPFIDSPDEAKWRYRKLRPTDMKAKRAHYHLKPPGSEDGNKQVRCMICPQTGHVEFRWIEVTERRPKPEPSMPVKGKKDSPLMLSLDRFRPNMVKWVKPDMSLEEAQAICLYGVADSMNPDINEKSRFKIAAKVVARWTEIEDLLDKTPEQKEAQALIDKHRKSQITLPYLRHFAETNPGIGVHLAKYLVTNN